MFWNKAKNKSILISTFPYILHNLSHFVSIILRHVHGDIILHQTTIFGDRLRSDILSFLITFKKFTDSWHMHIPVSLVIAVTSSPPCSFSPGSLFPKHLSSCQVCREISVREGKSCRESQSDSYHCPLLYLTTAWDKVYNHWSHCTVLAKQGLIQIKKNAHKPWYPSSWSYFAGSVFALDM